MKSLRISIVCILLLAVAAPLGAQPITGWLEWRGPNQNGTSLETDLPDSVDAANPLWTYDLPGRGTAVVARYDDRDRLFALGYRGEGANIVETLVCLDAKTGALLWERAYPDFLSDIIYERYSIGAPAVDADTGHVYIQTSPGLLIALDKDGNELWQHSLMEAFGRLTFPNGRTGPPTIDGDLVIVNAITSNWGSEGRGANRFYAFDKRSGDLVWSSDPGPGPPLLKDSSFSTPIFETRGGMRVFYAGTGDGYVVAVNALNGKPIWRYQMSLGGLNASMVISGDTLVAIHGKENVDDTGRGRMVALRLGAQGDDLIELGTDHELWRNDELSMFTSSPVVVDGNVYQVTANGELFSVDVASGETNWHKKVGPDQLHASPLYADGKLYVPLWNGSFYIVRPGDGDGEVLSHVKLAGQAIGSPSVFNGRVYVHTTEKLYCFGDGNEHDIPALPDETIPPAGEPVALQVVPGEVLMRPGDRATFIVRPVDRVGAAHAPIDNATWQPQPPGLNAAFDDGVLIAPDDAQLSAGGFRATSGELTGTFRGRVLSELPIVEDFDGFELTGASRTNGAPFAQPPGPWVSARPKWEVCELDGDHVLGKTLNIVLFQRSMVFVGHSDTSNYTAQVDVRSDGNRRLMSSGGVINQRYLVMLDGLQQKLRVVSNYDRVNEGVPFAWKPHQWYRIKCRVDLNDDGSGIIRAKAWPRDDAEPADWMIEVMHHDAHQHGAPGFWGFSPQSRYRVYLDNLSFTPNE